MWRLAHATWPGVPSETSGRPHSNAGRSVGPQAQRRPGASLDRPCRIWNLDFAVVEPTAPRP